MRFYALFARAFTPFTFGCYRKIELAFFSENGNYESICDWAKKIALAYANNTNMIINNWAVLIQSVDKNKVRSANVIQNLTPGVSRIRFIKRTIISSRENNTL